MTTLKKVNFLYCDYCGWKKVCRDASAIEIYKSNDKFKCQSCGRLIKLRLIYDAQKKLNIQINNEEKKEEFENWIKENLEE